MSGTVLPPPSQALWDASHVLAHSGGALPAPTASTWVLDWHLDPVLLAGVLLGAGLYLLGVRRLAERGDRWPVGRTIAWFGGLAVVVYATSSGVAAYDTTLFSAHMVQHMLLAMVAPVPLALAAPMTLALRTLPGGSGPSSPRGLLLRLIHSRLGRVLSNPLVTFAIFIANPFALYFTPLYEATLASTLLHEWLHVHFLVTGCLFFWTLVGVDPLPSRPSYPLRLLVVFAALPFHAFLGIAVMSSEALLAPRHYTAVVEAVPWYGDPLGDQGLGGGILWASGDLFAFLFLGVLFLQWSRAEERAAVREDRRLDRLEAQAARARSAAATARRAPVTAPRPAPDGDGARLPEPTTPEQAVDEDLAAYNAYLARLSADGGR